MERQIGPQQGRCALSWEKNQVLFESSQRRAGEEEETKSLKQVFL